MRHRVTYRLPSKNSDARQTPSVSTFDPVQQLEPCSGARPGSVWIWSGDDKLRLGISRTLCEPGCFAKRDQPTQHFSIANHWRCAEVRHEHHLRHVSKILRVRAGLASAEDRASRHLEAQQLAVGC